MRAALAVMWAIPLIGGAAAATPLQSFVDARVLAGAVTLIASDEKVLSLEAVGYADLAARRPMAADTVFWIASMSKPIAATAVMMLVDEGKIGLDDPVEKYLPEFGAMMVGVPETAGGERLRRPLHPITIRNLLTHTSGLVSRTPLEERIDRLTLDDNVRSYPMLPLHFEPGTQYEYSNAGINTAGRIIEIVSGLTYADFLQQRLFTPLGMTETTFWPTAAQLQRLAKSYQRAPGGRGFEEVPIEQLSYPLDRPERGGAPAGGLFSTAMDVYRFCQMILAGGSRGGRHYLSAAAIRTMTSTQTGALPVTMPSRFAGTSLSGYGFAWLTTRPGADGRQPADRAVFGHGGAYGTQMMIDPRRRIIAVFMVQRAGKDAENGRRIHAAFAQAVEEQHP